MSTPAVTPPSNSGGGFTGILASIGSALIPQNVQMQVDTVESEIEIALSVMVGLELIIAVELLILVAIAWKERH
jgi:hypothetical protein